MATGTLVDVVMPQMGVSVSEGTITRWAKNVGETIEADETIVEISTDKVDTEVPAPATGVVKELLAAEGETVDVNTRIAVIDTGGGGSDEGGGGGSATTGPDPDVAAETPQAAEEQPAEKPATAPAQPANGHGGGEGRTFVSPVVARMVAEHNLDINAIAGTGAGGRVTKKDVQAFIDSGGQAAAHGRPVSRPRCTTCRTSPRRPSPRPPHPRRRRSRARPRPFPHPSSRSRRRPRSSRASSAPARSSTASTRCAR